MREKGKEKEGKEKRVSLGFLTPHQYSSPLLFSPRSLRPFAAKFFIKSLYLLLPSKSLPFIDARLEEEEEERKKKRKRRRRRERQEGKDGKELILKSLTAKNCTDCKRCTQPKRGKSERE